MAKYVLPQEKLLKRTIVFCVFSNEERGAAGSKAFARKMRIEGKRIHPVVDLDILGYNALERPWRNLDGPRVPAFSHCSSIRSLTLLAAIPARAQERVARSDGSP